MCVGESDMTETGIGTEAVVVAEPGDEIGHARERDTIYVVT